MAGRLGASATVLASLMVLLPVVGAEPAAAPVGDAAQPTDSGAQGASEGIPEASVEYLLLATEGDAIRVAEIFIQQVMAGEYDAAFQGIRQHFPISERRFTKLAEETKKQHGLAQLQFGKPINHELADVALVKHSLLRIRFLEKFEWDAMYWEFLFYQPAQGWLLNGIGFDDDVHVLFRQ
jgi:hypothetical protein